MTDRPPGRSIGVWFTPERQITVSLEKPVDIKGTPPGNTNGVHFAEVYSSAPSLTLEESLVEIDRTFAGQVRDVNPARRILALCEVATSGPGSRRLGPYPSSTSAGWATMLNRPYRISDSHPEKIAHSFQWIHTNLSQHLDRLPGISPPELVFHAFSVLLKAEDYHLARTATPNGSIAIQNAVLGTFLPRHWDFSRQSGWRRNSRALDTLRQMHNSTDLLELCELSTFAGSTWFARRDADVHTCDELPGLLRYLGRGGRWGVDHRAEFIGQALEARSLALVLDDCGEAVFDVVLLAELLHQNSALKATVLARSRPDGVNVTVDDVHHILQLTKIRCPGNDLTGRVRVVGVDQPFPAFEPRFLTRRTTEFLTTADVVMIKGAAFFETMLLPRPTYHAFVVHGESSQRLTCLPKGAGVFQRVDDPESAYELTSVVGAE